MIPIFVVAPIPHVMHAVLNHPMLPHQPEDLVRWRGDGGQTGHDGDPLLGPERVAPDLSSPTHPPHLLHILPAPHIRKVGPEVGGRYKPEFTNFEAAT